MDAFLNEHFKITVFITHVYDNFILSNSNMDRMDEKYITHFPFKI